MGLGVGRSRAAAPPARPACRGRPGVFFYFGGLEIRAFRRFRVWWFRGIATREREHTHKKRARRKSETCLELVGEVAVQIRAAEVLARPPGEAIGIHAGDLGPPQVFFLGFSIVLGFSLVSGFDVWKLLRAKPSGFMLGIWAPLKHKFFLGFGDGR